MNLIRKSRCASILSYMICLIFILVSSLAFQGCQKDEFVTDDNVISPRLTQIITTFELKKTSIIPENIKAIEFPNEGKLEAFLKNMKKDKKCVIKGVGFPEV